MERNIASSLFIQLSLSIFGFLLLISVFSEKPTAGIAKAKQSMAQQAQVGYGQ